MDALTRRQLLALCRDFYAVQAEGFDASRGHEPWPGWHRLAQSLPRARGSAEAPLRVLDVGCGNARLATCLARELAEGAEALDYVGVDASPALLRAARARLAPGLARRCRLVELDFLTDAVDGGRPGDALPPGPFDLVALMGVLHHVPGADWRLALLAACARRLAPGGRLALAVWRFAGRPRFERRRVAWEALGPVLGRTVDPARLEAGDGLLRFGADPERPPRYCHQVDEAEIAGWSSELGLEGVDDYLADGAEGDLNRYRILARPT